MKKIPTVFERDWNGDRSRVLEEIVPGCEWVFDGEGVATQKLDGTCCLVDGGTLFKRHEVKPGKETPDGFLPIEEDEATGAVVGWVRVKGGPEDKWHREALHRGEHPDGTGFPPGTYELVGPKINGNPEALEEHVLVAHDPASTVLAVRVIEDVVPPITHAALAAWFIGRNMEGIVWHHPDGRMAKIKSRDFGIKRAS